MYLLYYLCAYYGTVSVAADYVDFSVTSLWWALTELCSGHTSSEFFLLHVQLKSFNPIQIQISVHAIMHLRIHTYMCACINSYVHAIFMYHHATLIRFKVRRQVRDRWNHLNISKIQSCSTSNVISITALMSARQRSEPDVHIAVSGEAMQVAFCEVQTLMLGHGGNLMLTSRG